MRLFMYIWRNASRNRLRSLLTILSVGFSLAMMTVLYGYLAMLSLWADVAEPHNRIVVMNMQGFSGRVPIAYVDRVAAMDEVIAAVPYQWYGGMYGTERMPFAQFATDPEHVFEVWPDFQIDPQQLSAWQENRQGVVADSRLAERRGWKLGDRIKLQGTYYPFNLDLELVGTFTAPQPTESVLFHWKYLDEGLRQAGYEARAGSAGTLWAKVKSADLIPKVSQEIDERYSSSENPTRTQTEAAFAQMFTDMMGNVQAYIRNIGLAVMFSLTLVAANSMAMSLRERTTEIAVLKAIGFPKTRVLGMVLGESCFISLLGGVLGLAGGLACIELLHRAARQYVPLGAADMAGSWMGSILAIAAGIGVVSGIVPAVRAARLSVIDGLRRVV
jgi:putative ABC transport system permease protein